MQRVDILIIGAGMAGVSAGYYLSTGQSPGQSTGPSVLVVEAETQPAYHTTGRSAAFLAETYGGPEVMPLTAASRDFLVNPPRGFTDVPLSGPLRALHVTRSHNVEAGHATARAAQKIAPDVHFIDAAEALALAPLLRPRGVTGAVYDPGCLNLDVNAIHSGFLAGMKACGGHVLCDAPVRAITATGDGWQVDTAAGPVRATTLINAAGAWGDDVARLAGVAALGLVPMRRTIIAFDPPAGALDRDGPMVLDFDEQWYVKPESGMVLASPADETPSAPCDAQPEDIDVALAVDRIERFTTLKIPRIDNKWAGLRTFSPDRAPVIGYDAAVPGFFWCVGQGGFGIQTAPAMGQLTAALALKRPVPAALARLGIRAETYSPDRFR